MHALLKVIEAGHNVIIARHSQTGKAEVDADRQLTEAGIALAQRVGRRITLNTNRIGVVFHSSAKRCEQTAEAMLCDTLHLEMIQFVSLEEAYPLGPKCHMPRTNAAFATLRDGPIMKYDAAGCTEEMEKYASNVVEAIDNALWEKEPELVDDVLIVVHAVCAPALARWLGRRLGHDVSEIEEFRTPECGVIVVSRNASVCVTPPAE